jgi:tetratricopeptide (TPR) repeat protein
MPKVTISKKQLQVTIAIFLVLSFTALIFGGYPWLQLQVASRLYSSGNYAQAEQVLSSLIRSRPDWTEPRYKLVQSQLQLGKSQQAALTVISLAESRLGPAKLASVYMEVAIQLINSGNAAGALELTIKVLAERDQEMLRQAALEVAFRIAEHNDLPLALDALNIAIELSGDNWVLTRRAFNLLMAKALSAPDHLAEPALERALELYPDDVIAFTRKVRIMSARTGARHALDWLLEKEANFSLEEMSPEYFLTKKDLILRLASSDFEISLVPYTAGMSDTLLRELALQGIANAQSRNRAGTRFYQLASHIPEVAFTYGWVLFQNGSYQEASQVFEMLRKDAPDFANHAAISAALRSKTLTRETRLEVSGDSVDTIALSSNGNWLAMRSWMTPPWIDDNVTSNLLVRNLTTGQELRLGDVMLFSWSPADSLLAYLTVQPTGLGSLNVVNTMGENLFQLSPQYAIIDFNWSISTLMIQAEDIATGQIKLLQVRGPHWGMEQVIDWEISGPLNQELTWIAPGDNRLHVYRHLQVPREIFLGRPVVGYSPWSPNGRFAVIHGLGQQHWLFDHNTLQVQEIPTAGFFAGWAHNSLPYWYYPLWDGLYVLARLNSLGNVSEFLPFTFTDPHQDLHIAANGALSARLVDGKPWIARR